MKYKPMKDCKWKIRMQCFGGLQIMYANWVAYSENYLCDLISKNTYKTKKALKKDWERFAQLNGIPKKNYVYVD